MTPNAEKDAPNPHMGPPCPACGEPLSADGACWSCDWGPTPDNPVIHRSGCSWETTPYCNCGADPDRTKEES